MKLSPGLVIMGGTALILSVVVLMFVVYSIVNSDDEKAPEALTGTILDIGESDLIVVLEELDAFGCAFASANWVEAGDDDYCFIYYNDVDLYPELELLNDPPVVIIMLPQFTTIASCIAGDGTWDQPGSFCFMVEGEELDVETLDIGTYFRPQIEETENNVIDLGDTPVEECKKNDNTRPAETYDTAGDYDFTQYEGQSVDCVDGNLGSSGQTSDGNEVGTDLSDIRNNDVGDLSSSTSSSYDGNTLDRSFGNDFGETGIGSSAEFQTEEGTGGGASDFQTTGRIDETLDYWKNSDSSPAQAGIDDWANSASTTDRHAHADSSTVDRHEHASTSEIDIDAWANGTMYPTLSKSGEDCGSLPDVTDLIDVLSSMGGITAAVCMGANMLLNCSAAHVSASGIGGDTEIFMQSINGTCHLGSTAMQMATGDVHVEMCPTLIDTNIDWDDFLDLDQLDFAKAFFSDDYDFDNCETYEVP